MATGSTLALSTPTSPTEGDKLTFHWTTTAPDTKNWVGIYDGTRLPGTGSSLLWKYTPGGSGDVQLDTSALTGGPYTAYLLAKDGYGILAQTAPFSFKPKAAAARPHAAVDALTATQAAPGGAVSIKLAGLWQHGTGTPTYRRTGGDSWLSVAADGTVTGTAPATALAHPAVVTVEIKDPSGVSDTVTVQVPVRDAAGPLRLKAASWNLSAAGAAFTDAQEKQLRVILAQGLDVLALQETAGTAAQALATALGWYAYQSTGSVGVLSRYPLTAVTATTTSLPAAGVTLQLPGGRSVRFWSAHLDETGYGPYAIQDGQTAAQVQTAEAASTRGKQATALATAVQADAAGGKPVILAAALASPSHLDWTAATGRPLAWPVTTTLQNAGLTDAYRAAQPDPAASPGNTWSPTRKVRGTKAEPQDRIDQVQFAGPLTLVEAHTLATGWPQPDPSTAANEWPSDTAAAVATFTL
ncbi:endonuclease/exonuclease/phosphatase family protein [Kitasatospora sp. McL0602]|uniref:endonuclease/exonuclease/phosphatase family protein n=1 Tax=Kitasatospora sp. McL0602 TaxID=3439530 RepID=UPI003F8B250C